MRFHAQNLNEKKHGKMGWILRHGRAWLAVWNMRSHCEWHFFARQSSMGFELALSDYDEDAVGGHVTLPWLCGLYWGFSTPKLKAFTDRITSRDKGPKSIGGGRFYWPTNGRTMGIRFSEGTLWIDLWNDPMEHHSVDPKWWHISINVKDLLCGRPVHSEKTLETRRVKVPMPEGGYWAEIKLKEEAWKRPRGFRKVLTRAHVAMEEGQQIPFPGKGENSWDCGEDATYSLCCPADSVFEGMMKMTKSVMQKRERYGGKNWVPGKLQGKV